MPTLGLRPRLPGYSTGAYLIGRPIMIDAGRPRKGRAVVSDGRRESGAGAASLGGALGLETLQRDLRVIDEAHGRGDRAVTGVLGDQPVHRLAHAAVGRVALRRRAQPG